MKLPSLSRLQVILLIAVALLLAGNAWLYRGYRQEQQQIDEWDREYRRVSGQVNDLEQQYDIPRLEQEWAEALAELESEATFPEKVEPLDVADLVISTAVTHNVSLDALDNPVSTAKTVGSSQYQVVQYDISAHGELPQLQEWLKGIEDSERSFSKTLYSNALNLSSGEGTWNASFSLMVLTQ